LLAGGRLCNGAARVQDLAQIHLGWWVDVGSSSLTDQKRGIRGGEPEEVYLFVREAASSSERQLRNSRRI